MAENAPMPPTLTIVTEHYSEGWSSVAGSTGTQLGKDIEDAGWTFFDMAGEIRTRGLGFNDQSRTARATAHLTDALERESCNCSEITQIRRRSFFGLPYTSVSAHARHIQESRRFHDRANVPAKSPFGSREPLDGQPAAVRSSSLFAGQAVQTWENEGGSRA